MLNSTEHGREFQLLQKTKMLKNKAFLASKLSNVFFVMLINVKMQTLVGILTFMSMIHFMHTSIEHEKSLIRVKDIDLQCEYIVSNKKPFFCKKTLNQLKHGCCRELFPW